MSDSEPIDEINNIASPPGLYPDEAPLSLRPIWLRKRPAKMACCTFCGSPLVCSLPTYSVGQGLAYSPMAEDVYCRRCGEIGLPTIPLQKPTKS